MPALKNVISETRSLFKWGGLLISTLFLIFIFIKIGTLFKDRFFPTPPPRPAVAFGKLPAPLFPAKKTNPKITYSVDTLTGTLPSFPDRVKIYMTIGAKPNLLAFENMQKKVANLGFNSQGTQVSTDTYQWQTQEPMVKKLTVDIFSYDFSLTSSFIQDSQNQSFLNSQDQSNAINTATSFIESITSIPQDLDMAKTKTSLFTIQNKDIAPVTKVSLAKIIKVDFFQKDIDQLPIFYPNNSTMSMLLGRKTGEDLQVVEGEFVHQSISNDGSTYPIKSADEAFSQLKLGNAYIVSDPKNSNNINIKKVTLGYYLGELRQDYLLPVIVFEDDFGFTAFVSAVKDEWVNK